MGFAAKLTYFKPSGKFYSEGVLHTRHTESNQIMCEVECAFNMRRLPGLMQGHSQFITLVEIPCAEDFVPRLLMPVEKS